MSGGGGTWEDSLGAARAVAAGDRVLVSGTAPLADDGGVSATDEAYEQTRAAFTEAVAALEPFGVGAEAVIRTRMYLSHVRDVEEVARAHRELFAAVRPVSTVVVTAGFVDPRVLVTVELEAYRGSERSEAS
ncbi:MULTISPECIES: Rid family hydrolase [Streptomyces]|uniref:Enamine deaminase RidA, house cleaning of reactive enamine intermediates, YjgF/YER057c/UK114 family n=1 Tax=Streptomyces harbinensis TaxID=1176198 RepID=A0A1I6RVW3_9ACTN|nr:MULTISPECIES: Rid family hydrolase [Streptomyces]MCK1814544.1 Rid family hydrolase [Streptomyces sp. XM4011]QKV68320.1 RidA family protein [Streptomyces harbinensis]SFS68826.1 Enamine deaminase RidA, house cleaning of reactive enamine intermediates, YjgF/YER057c/UK114 family [Streptomyces harbinensis]